MTISQILVRRLISRIVSYVLVSYTNQLKNADKRRIQNVNVALFTMQVKIILADILRVTLVVTEWLKQ